LTLGRRKISALEDSVLDRLHEAAARGILRWSTDTDDANREVWKSELAGESLRIELIYVKRASDDSFERFAVEVSAFGHLLIAGLGSKRYDTVMDMLSFSMHGWRDANAAKEKKLKKTLSTLDSLLGKNGN
jgi:hypothetical protein